MEELFATFKEISVFSSIVKSDAMSVCITHFHFAEKPSNLESV